MDEDLLWVTGATEGTQEGHSESHCQHVWIHCQGYRVSCMCACMRACVRACVRVCVRAHMCACAYVCMCACVHACMHVHVHECVCPSHTHSIGCDYRGVELIKRQPFSLWQPQSLWCSCWLYWPPLYSTPLPYALALLRTFCVQMDIVEDYVLIHLPLSRITQLERCSVICVHWRGLTRLAQ